MVPTLHSSQGVGKKETVVRWAEPDPNIDGNVLSREGLEELASKGYDRVRPPTKRVAEVGPVATAG